MPNKTLYVKDSDLPIWEKVEQLSPNGVSSLVTTLLKTYTNQHAVADEQGMTTIVVECRYGSEGRAHPIQKSFVGRWLIAPEEGLTQEYPSTETNIFVPEFFAVALTKKGAIAVYEGDDTDHEHGWAELNHYRTFEEFRDAKVLDEKREPSSPRYPDNVVAAVAAALDRDYVVHLDI